MDHPATYDNRLSREKWLRTDDYKNSKVVTSTVISKFENYGITYAICSGFLSFFITTAFSSNLVLRFNISFMSCNPCERGGVDSKSACTL
jgi:hypothetical protein